MVTLTSALCVKFGGRFSGGENVECFERVVDRHSLQAAACVGRCAFLSGVNLFELALPCAFWLSVDRCALGTLARRE